MRHKMCDYYYYKKPQTGIYYCSPLSKITRKKLFTVSTGTKDYKEAKRIMDSWAVNNIFPKPFEKSNIQPINVIDVLATFQAMVVKKEFGGKDIVTVIYQLVDAYQDYIAENVKDFLNCVFSMLHLEVDVSNLFENKAKKKKTDVKFKDYILNFWDYEASPYMKDLINCGTLAQDMPKEDRFFHYKQSIGKYISWFDDDLLLCDVSADLINCFFSHLLKERGVSQSYMFTLSKMITQPLRYAERKHLIKAGIVSDIKKYKDNSKIKDILTVKEASILFSNVDNFKNLKHYCINRFALESASRIGEILALKTNDIKININEQTNQEECWITISKSYNFRTCKVSSTKTKEIKTITISKELLAFLKQLIEVNPHKKKVSNPFLFFNSKDSTKPVSYTEVSREFKRVMNVLGFARPSLTFHSYRHLAVVILADNNASTREIMSITGHKSEKMVSRYANHTTEKQKENKRMLVTKITNNFNFIT